MIQRSFLSRLVRDAKEKSAPIGEAPPSSTTSASHTNKNASRETERCLLDIYQTENDIVIKALIAGVRPENLDVSIANGVLTIHGARMDDRIVHADHYIHRECYIGSFSRSVILPENSGEDAIAATLKNGVLTIRIPKKKERRIAINTD